MRKNISRYFCLLTLIIFCLSLSSAVENTDISDWSVSTDISESDITENSIDFTATSYITSAPSLDGGAWSHGAEIQVDNGQEVIAQEDACFGSYGSDVLNDQDVIESSVGFQRDVENVGSENVNIRVFSKAFSGTNCEDSALVIDQFSITKEVREVESSNTDSKGSEGGSQSRSLVLTDTVFDNGALELSDDSYLESGDLGVSIVMEGVEEGVKITAETSNIERYNNNDNYEGDLNYELMASLEGQDVSSDQKTVTGRNLENMVEEIYLNPGFEGLEEDQSKSYNVYVTVQLKYCATSNCGSGWEEKIHTQTFELNPEVQVESDEEERTEENTDIEGRDGNQGSSRLEPLRDGLNNGVETAREGVEAVGDQIGSALGSEDGDSQQEAEEDSTDTYQIKEEDSFNRYELAAMASVDPAFIEDPNLDKPTNVDSAIVTIRNHAVGNGYSEGMEAEFENLVNEYDLNDEGNVEISPFYQATSEGYIVTAEIPESFDNVPNTPDHEGTPAPKECYSGGGIDYEPKSYNQLDNDELSVPDFGPEIQNNEYNCPNWMDEEVDWQKLNSLETEEESEGSESVWGEEVPPYVALCTDVRSKDSPEELGIVGLFKCVTGKNPSASSSPVSVNDNNGCTGQEYSDVEIDEEGQYPGIETCSDLVRDVCNSRYTSIWFEYSEEQNTCVTTYG